MARRKTKEDFIKEGVAKYGKKFDYSKVKYINWNTRVEIICPIHGSQWVIPASFLGKSKMGCLDCAKEESYEQIRLKEEKAFLEFCKNKFGDEYDYSEMEYINCFTDIKIWDNKYKKFFWQTPTGHKQSKYHPDETYKMRGKVQSENCGKTFIERAVKVHEDAYGYDRVKYKTADEDVEIFCKKCQVYFWQRPHDHLAGKGHIDCSGVKKKTTEEFIKKSKAKFGDKFDYSKTEYVNANTELIVTCCDHGDQKITPASHYRSDYGCQDCANEARNSDRREKASIEFESRAREVHGEKYSYEKVIYKNNRLKVKIYCNECECYFDQSPDNHLSGRGHDGCKNSSDAEVTMKEFLDSNNVKNEPQKRFEDCLYKKQLPFDFYLPEHNILCEVQGKQHYESVEFFGGDETFKLQQIRDAIKKDYAIKNGYTFLEIPYWDFDKIPEILTTALNLTPKEESA